ncbi:MAG TPA: L-serine ammonia-lyase [Steroidobacteraceae bacterium]|nr:L-serine ammonia-lyase [Steroidobacteraceae bacterium]
MSLNTVLNHPPPAPMTPPGTRRDPPVALGDLFKIGIGPSSSHTVGPMKAAGLFVQHLAGRWDEVQRLLATVYGSLAWTGKGHATDKALMLGLAGERVDTIDPELVEQKLLAMLASRKLTLPDGRSIQFDPKSDIVFDTVHSFQRHPNAMTFEAFDAAGRSVLRELWFSIGGGFVEQDAAGNSASCQATVPYPYDNAETLLALGRSNGLSIAALVLANETTQRSAAETLDAIDRIAGAMHACIERGLSREGPLPGGLKIKRRAKGLYEKAEAARSSSNRAGLDAMNYVSAFAIAVNEENACGGRVVTAPTNGAAGVVPAVLRYYRDFCTPCDRQGVANYFLAATAIGGIIKRNASISGAEMGCQGEVASAAAMAAAGLAAALGGSNEQIENAAEIALEHHLGMTCDPIGGLVQIPCIERNAFGAIKAINAASMALHGDGTHRVSLDQAIETLRQTGTDMQSKYRETSRGGLAVNVPEC